MVSSQTKGHFRAYDHSTFDDSSEEEDDDMSTVLEAKAAAVARQVSQAGQSTAETLQAQSTRSFSAVQSPPTTAFGFGNLASKNSTSRSLEAPRPHGQVISATRSFKATTSGHSALTLDHTLNLAIPSSSSMKPKKEFLVPHNPPSASVPPASPKRTHVDPIVEVPSKSTESVHANPTCSSELSDIQEKTAAFSPHGPLALTASDAGPSARLTLAQRPITPPPMLQKTGGVSYTPLTAKQLREAEITIALSKQYHKEMLEASPHQVFGHKKPRTSSPERPRKVTSEPRASSNARPIIPLRASSTGSKTAPSKKTALAVSPPGRAPSRDLAFEQKIIAMRVEAAADVDAICDEWGFSREDVRRRERRWEDKIHDVISRHSASNKKEAESDEPVTKTKTRPLASAPKPNLTHPTPKAPPMPAAVPGAPTRSKSENDKPDRTEGKPSPRKRAKTEPELPSPPVYTKKPPVARRSAPKAPLRPNSRKSVPRRKTEPKPVLTTEQKEQARMEEKAQAVSECDPEIRRKNRLHMTERYSLPEYVAYIEKFGVIGGAYEGNRTTTFASCVFYFVCKFRQGGGLGESERSRIDYLVTHGATIAKTFNESVTHVIISDPYAGVRTLAERLGIESAEDVPIHVPVMWYNWWIDHTCKLKPPGLPTSIHLQSWDVTCRHIPANAGEKVRKPYIPTKRGRTDEESESEAEAEEQQPRIPIEGFRRERRHDTPDPEEEDASSNEEAKVKEIISLIAAKQSQENVNQRDALVEDALKAGVDGLDLTDDESGDEDDAQDHKSRLRLPRMIGNYLCNEKVTSGPKETCANQDVVDQLRQMVKVYETLPGAQFNAIQTRKCINKVQAHPTRIRTLEEARKLAGPKTAVKIMDVINTGMMKRLQHELSLPEYKAINAFIGIYGVGAGIAREWLQRGLKTLEDVRNGKNGVVLSPAQQIGLQHYDDLAERMPREEAEIVFQRVKAVAHEIDPLLTIDIMGSFRRGKPTCGDIDILITKDDNIRGRSHAGLLDKLLPLLHERGILTHDLSLPKPPNHPRYTAYEQKYMGLCLGPSGKQRRIDILTIPYHQWGAALLYFTGDDIFNRRMRLQARHMGLSLSQHGLFYGVVRDPKTGRKTCDGTCIASRTEQEIFKLLSCPWREPHERHQRGPDE